MIDTHIYDYDTYSRDIEMSTQLCAELVMSDIDTYLRDRSNLSLDDYSVFSRLLERNLHLAAENKVFRTVLDSYNWIDIDTKSISGANVEVVRDIVGPQDLLPMRVRLKIVTTMCLIMMSLLKNYMSAIRRVMIFVAHQRLCLLIVKVILIELVESLKLIFNIMDGVIIRGQLVLKQI